MLKLYFFIFLFLFSVVACKPPHKVENEIPDNITGSFLVLNEGLFQQNNSSLTYFNWITSQNADELFEKKNFVGMGDTGNDLANYGDKIFVLMNNSHVMHVLNKRTGKLIEQVHFQENGIGSSPRYMAFHQGFLYVSAFNGYLYKLDTNSVSVQDKIILGANPDFIVPVYNELWVANSGGLIPQGDSTVSVVDLNTFSEIDRIAVGTNPGSMAFDGNSVYVVSRGDFVSIPSRLIKFDAQTKSLQNSLTLDLSGVRYFDNRLFITTYDYANLSSSIREIDPITLETISDNLIAHLPIQTLYGFYKMEVFGQKVYAVLDAKQYVHQGKVFILDDNFNLLFSFSVGLNPSKIVFNAP